MKHFTLILGIGLMLFSCKSDKVGPKPTDKVIKYQKSIDLPNGTLTFTGVADGRCPQEVVCIWGGSVTIDLLLKSKKDEKTVKLILGQGTELTKSKISLDGITYLIDFMEVVSPTYRSSVNPIPKEDYSIKLKIQTVP